MSSFTPLVDKEYAFEGDEVKVRFSRLKRKHMLSVMPHLAALGGLDKDVDLTSLTSEQASAMNELLNDIIDVVPEYVKEFSGLKDSDGNPVQIGSVVDDFYFLGLATMIAMDMVKESSPVKEGNV